jgi:hypothetical protein
VLRSLRGAEATARGIQSRRGPSRSKIQDVDREVAAVS